MVFLMVTSWDLLGFYGDLMGFNGFFNGDFMGFTGILL